MSLPQPWGPGIFFVNWKYQMRLILLFFVVLNGVFSSAQAEEKKADVYWKGFFKGGMVLRVDGKEYPGRFWKNSYPAEEAFADNVEAAEYARLHEKYGARGSLFFWGGILSAITYLFVAEHNDNFKKRIYYPLLWGPIIPFTYYSNKSHKYLLKAMDLHNGPESKKVSHWRWGSAPTSNGGSFGLVYDF